MVYQISFSEFMKSSILQKHINAVRKGDIFNVFEMSKAITDHYKPLKTIGDADSIIALLIFELSKTDIDSKDIDQLNFLYNFLGSKEEFQILKMQFSRVLIAVSNVLAIKQKKLIDTLVNYNITSKKDLELLTRVDDSIFPEYANYKEQQVLILEKLKNKKNDVIQKHILALKNEEFKLFYDGFISKTNEVKKIESHYIGIHKKSQKQSVEYHFPIIEKRLEADKLIKAVEQYRNYLDDKFTSKGKDANKHPNLKARFDAINQFYNHILDTKIINSSVVKEGQDAIQSCKKHQAPAEERSFINIILNILTLGISHLIRSFFHRSETKMRTKVEDIVAQNEASLKPSP